MRYGFPLYERIRELRQTIIISLMLKRLLPIFLAFASFSLSAMAQDTSQAVAGDTTKLKSAQTFRLFPAEHSPKAAGIASAVLPGLGQAYNRKYWKIPIIYAGLATAGYFIYYNYTIYSNFQKAYELRNDGDTSTNLSSFDVWYITSTQTIYTDGYESTQLSELSNIYRRSTDLSIIIAAGIYALNIIDAVVDAHLFRFDVSDNLSMNLQPFYTPPALGKSRGGVMLTMTMK